MGAAYSQDLRDRILAARDEGMTTKRVAELFRVSPSWVRRVMQRRREHCQKAQCIADVVCSYHLLFFSSRRRKPAVPHRRALGHFNAFRCELRFLYLLPSYDANMCRLTDD